MQKIVPLHDDDSSYSKQVNALKTLRNDLKSIPTKYLYDDYGSKLFEKICKTEEYYLTRTEENILNKYCSDIITTTQPEDMFELGSGSSKKTKILINQVLKKSKPFSYSSLDISSKALEMSFKELTNLNKKIKINLFKGDFILDIDKLKLRKQHRLFLFLGSTLGNFPDKIAIQFLSNVRNIMKKKDFLLLGVDMIKDIDIIMSAYNDKTGITKSFNKNILKVINKKYRLDFNLNNFDHHTEFNQDKSQIEMYLKSKKDQKISNHLKDFDINIKSGEKILTEISRKFSSNILKTIFKKAKLKIIERYKDENNFYSLFLLTRS